MKKDEETLKLNVEKKKESKSIDKYKKYEINESGSEISEEDIETKMNRLIKIRKAQRDKIKVSPLDLDSLKKDADKFKKKKNENKEKKEKENKNKIEEGLKEFEKNYKKIIKNIFMKKLKIKANSKKNIKKGFEDLENIHKKIKKNKRKNVFLELKK